MPTHANRVNRHLQHHGMAFHLQNEDNTDAGNDENLQDFLALTRYSFTAGATKFVGVAESRVKVMVVQDPDVTVSSWSTEITAGTKSQCTCGGSMVGTTTTREIILSATNTSKFILVSVENAHRLPVATKRIGAAVPSTSQRLRRVRGTTSYYYLKYRT